MDLFSIMTGPLNRMSHVTRYSSHPVHRKENVAEHSWWVTFIALMISEDLQGMGYDINTARLLSRALVHDMDECLSGDIIRTFKYASPEVHEAIAAASSENMYGLTAKMHPVGTGIKYDWDHAKDDDVEGHIVSFADMATVAFYCREEYRSGNRAVLEVLKENYEHWFFKYHEHGLLGRYADQMFPNRRFTDMLVEAELTPKSSVPPGQMSLVHSEGPVAEHDWATDGQGTP